ncbi:MAG: hypothetical protein K8W52_15900 [Deltaproteobacteria bacterium]|nr:hypothetical protein [Deltaproteobacteria bacterium]
MLGLGLGACVEPFAGSNVQLDFSGDTHTIQRAGQARAPLQPPVDTYYALWAVDTVTDDAGGTKDYVFAVQNFEIKPLIDQNSPCFIDLEGARFPGLHVTQFANKVKEQTGIADPFNAPAGATDGDISDVLTALKRLSYLGDLQSKVKAVVTTSNFKYGPSATTCLDDDAGADQTMFPPTNCTGPKSNALRLKLCKAAWAANPDFYEGSDKVFTLPLSGTYYGTVEGTNPINNGYVGGSGFFVDESLLDFDRYFITWQYKDLNGDGTPDYADNTPEDDKAFGHVYMSGIPRRVARGVISVALQSPENTSIGAAMSIFPDLANDGTHF